MVSPLAVPLEPDAASAANAIPRAAQPRARPSIDRKRLLTPVSWMGSATRGVGAAEGVFT